MSGAVLVVGVRGGVGQTVARQLVATGRRVVGTVRTAGQFAEVRAAIPGLADLFELDLDDADAVLATLAPRLAGAELAAVIVCAAQCHYRPLETESLTAARRAMEVNALSNLAIYQAAMPALRRNRGTLVLVSSNSGLVCMPFLGSYQASKFALEALGDAMRMEAARFGVRVVLIEPGGMDTAMSRGMASGIPGAIAALSEHETALYGDLYAGFRKLLAGEHVVTPLEQVAGVIIAALDSEDPEPRYPVGADTALLLSRRRELSDREMDEFALSIYGVSGH